MRPGISENSSSLPGACTFTSLPEINLLLLTARETMCETHIDGVRETLQQCRYATYFVSSSYVNKTHLLAWQNLSHFRDAASPFLTSVRRQLEPLCTSQWRRYLARLDRTYQLTSNLLSQNDIPHTFIRGLSLARRYYGNPLLRDCCDVDVLVPPSVAKHALEVLREAGFRPHGNPMIQNARLAFEGQAELVEPRQRILLDVNWALTANLGMGHVERDFDTVWGRATCVGNHEYCLSHEDLILEVVRHVGHGHSFEDNLVRSCCDIQCILDTTAGQIDWDHICREAERCESWRVLAYFAHFFDTFYGNYVQGVKQTLPLPERAPSARGRDRYAHIVLAPLILRRPIKSPLSEFMRGSACVAGKLMATDRLSRLARLLLIALWPPRYILVFLTFDSRIKSYTLRRLRYYFMPFPFLVPAGLLGTTWRLVDALMGTCHAFSLRFIRKTRTLR